MRHAHVVGAGLAGLAAALDLSEGGWAVTLHEGGPQAGGRCRSFHDAVLDRRIDNGNHLILSGNRAVLAHAARIGAVDRLAVADEAAFAFADLDDGSHFVVRVPATPLGALRADARPPGAGAGAALRGVLGLLAAGAGASVADVVLDRGAMWRGFWVPMTTAVLNAPPERASAALMRAVLVRTFLRGAAACRPVTAPEGLGEALIEPAVATLAARGVVLRTRARLASVAADGGRATALHLGGEAVALGTGDAVVLALPPAALASLMPDLPGPRPGPAILNAHFRVDPALARDAPPLLGLLGSQAQWVFRRGDVLSVTVSAAEDQPAWAMPKEAALDHLWSEVARGLRLGAARPLAARLLRERAATFDQSPAGAASRPGVRTPLENVVLAGDHVRTGLPATLEGAVRSGHAAARALMRSGARA